MGKHTSDKKLNKSQIEAIEYGEGPLLIIAGAGTGKTTVVTERIKNLITKKRILPEEILALTFTEKGAREMEERVDMAMPLSYGDMWIMTFHSFCEKILRAHAIEIGLPGNFKLMTEAESVDLIRRNLFDFTLDYYRPLGNPNKFISAMLTHFSRLQDETVTTSEYLNFSYKYKNDEELEVKKINELANAYKFYDDLKIKEGKFDFGDLITKTIELFEKRPNILSIYQDKFKYILIDEFQDTNFAQNKLAMLLSGKLKNITVVGDDDQSIYRFRGASVSNIVQFRKNFPKAHAVVLTENYRSRQEILDASYNLIQNNNPDRLEFVEKIDKKLIAKCEFKKSKDLPVELIHVQSVMLEAEEVVNQIEKVKLKNDFDYKDFAILVRANSHADPFVRELERRGLPHQFLGPSKLFEKEEIVELISYLRVLKNLEDNESFYRLLTSEIFNLDPLDLIKITTYAKRKSLSIFELITNDKTFEISSKTKDVLDELLSMISDHLKLINKESGGSILFDYINRLNLLTKLEAGLEEAKIKNISKFFDKVKSYENANKLMRVNHLIDYIDLLTEVGDTPSVNDEDWYSRDAVNILTIHSSKGLEFKVVFIVNLVHLRFPSTERRDAIPIPDDLIKEVLPKGDFHLQEERRLMYVAMTRAREKLYLTASDMYTDAKRPKKLSPFIFEALGENVESSMWKVESRTVQSGIQNKSILPSTSYLLPHKVDYLSVSQIEAFQTCPMHYKLKYIYKLPTPPNASISFGISIHNTLKDFLVQRKEILEIYKNNWIEEGYVNKKHKLEFYRLGEKYLLEFAKNKINNNIALEKSFKFKVDKSLTIVGAIDRIDKVGESYEIIDYKTGDKIPSQKEVDNNLQLSVYAMAVSEMYKVGPDKIKLTLYYLNGQTKISTKRSIKELEKVKDEILEVKKEIEASDFKCNNNYFCLQGCEYSMFCKNI